jgi:ribosomal protein S18 acetylase RimI-like enzyme
MLGQHECANRILRALPDWFGIESSIVEYVQNVQSLPTFVVRVGGDVVGFLTIKIHFPRAAEMYVLGVLKEHHRGGVGRAMVQAAERWLATQGVEYLQVKTLSASRNDANYARTRKFYEGVGFVALEEFPTLWNPRNPCLLMVKRIDR